MQEDYGKMLQNTLILGFFSISAFQDYRNKKINIYFENVNDLNRILEIMNIEIK